MVGVQIASLYADIGADISGFKRGMGTVDSMLHSTGGKLGGFVGMMGTGLVAAAATGAAGLAAMGAAIAKTTMQAGDAQQAVANIAANMSLSADETQKVAKLVQDLGIDPKLKVTATEAAAAIDMLGKNGLSLQQIFDGASRSTVLLANSTGADFATAADIATDVMAQFKIQAKDMMTAVNGITGTTQFSKFGINDYRLALAQAGGVAASVGVSFEDFNATIAAISPLFAGGSDAGTSFKTFLQRLTPSTKPATKAMKALGIITADGANQFYDAAGNMRSMAEVANVLQTAFAGLSDEQKNQYADTIFGTDAMRAAFALMQAGGATIDDYKQKIGNTDAEKAAATRMDTLKGDYEIFSGIIETLSIRIGEKFIPAARDMVQWLTKLATDNADQIVNFFGDMAGYIPKVADALAWGNTKWQELTTLMQPVTDAVGRFAENFKLLWLGIKENDVGIFSSGIRGIMFEVQRGLGVVLDYVRSVDWPTVLSGWADAFIKWGGAIWNNVFPYLRAAWDNITGWVTDPARREQLSSALASSWDWLKTWAGGVWSNNLQPALSAAWKSITAWVTDPTKRQELVNGITNTWNGFLLWGQGLWGTVRPYLVAAAANLRIWIDSNYPQLGTWIDAITKFATDAAASFGANLPQMGQRVTDLRTTVETEVPRIGESMSRLWKNLFGGGEGGGSGFGNMLSYFFENITWKISALIKQARIFVDVLNLMVEATKDVFSGNFDSYWNKREQFNSLIQQFMESNQGAPQFPGFATGGMFTRGGLALVGERGPEVVDLPGGSYVHNAVESAGMMGGSSRLDIYVHANGTMPTDRAAIRELAIALQRELNLTGARVVMP